MGKKAKDNDEKKRSRTWRLMLYPDCDSHVQALEIIKENYSCAYILHDKDTENDEIKKAHWHVVLTHPNAIWNTSLAEKLGIELNYMKKGDNIEKALEYLIHFNHMEKYQYSVDEVYGNLKVKLCECIEKGVKSESMRAIEIIEFIESQDKYISITYLSKWVTEFGLWSDYRRGFSIIKEILNEHNVKYRKFN